MTFLKRNLKFKKIIEKAKEQTHILQFPFLLCSYKCIPAFILAVLQLHSPLFPVQTQLLLNIVSNFVMCGILKILQHGEKGKMASTTVITLNDIFCQSEISNIFLLTWFPPSPWHGYMISCFPPSLFSPASRHESLPTFFTYKEREGKGKAVRGIKMKS